MIDIKNINLGVKHANKRGNRYILKNVSATFEPKKLNVIMGPSGSGKTSLLNLIYGKCEKSSLTSGSVLYNGSERDPIQWYRDVSLVEQHQFEIENKTPEQALRDIMDMHSRIPDDKFDRLVQGLQIEKILSTQMSSLSGGERKRVFIAMALMSTSKIIMLDEPVSDLDSQLALSLMTFIKKLAIEQDLTIVAIIHQPSPLLFELFDNLLFLYEGHSIYSSSVEGLEAALISKGLAVVEGFTVAEFLLEAFSPSSSFQDIEKLKPQVSKCYRELEEVWNSSLYKFTGNKSKCLDFEWVDFGCVYRLLFNSPYFDLKNILISFISASILGLGLALSFGNIAYDSHLYDNSRLLYRLMVSFEVFNVFSFFYDIIHPQISLRELINFRNTPIIHNVTKEISYSMYSMSSFYFANIFFVIMNQIIFFVPFWIIFTLISKYSFGPSFVAYFFVKTLATAFVRLFFKNVIVSCMDISKPIGSIVYCLVVGFVSLANFPCLYETFIRLHKFEYLFKVSKFLLRYLNPLFCIDLAFSRFYPSNEFNSPNVTNKDDFLNPLFNVYGGSSVASIGQLINGSDMCLLESKYDGLNLLDYDYSNNFLDFNTDSLTIPLETVASDSLVDISKVKIHPVVDYSRLLNDLVFDTNLKPFAYLIYLSVFLFIILGTKILMSRNYSTQVRLRL